MKTVHDLDPNLFIEALELLPDSEFSCHAITKAQRARDTDLWLTSSYSEGSEEHGIYAGLFAPREGQIKPNMDSNGRCFSWLEVCSDDSETELRAWRETALCFMAAICADPWENDE